MRRSQHWLSTDITYFQILIIVLLFDIFVECEIQDRICIFLYKGYESNYAIFQDFTICIV